MKKRKSSPDQQFLPGFEPPPDPKSESAAGDTENSAAEKKLVEKKTRRGSKRPVQPTTRTPAQSKWEENGEDFAPYEAGKGPLAGKSVYVVDAHALIYQLFHAMPEMSSPGGQPVGAVHGFARDILDLLERRKPDFLFSASDPHGPVFRHEIDTEYKANRDEMPTDLRSQIGNIQRLMEVMSVPILSVENYEADDVMATLARLVAEQGGTCFLVTNDKDCRQLLSDQVKLFNIRKNMLYDQKRLANDWGIRPDQVVDFQAMVGDSVDNIPGVPLIGPKIAGELLREFDTLEGVFANIENIKGKKRKENLTNHQDQAKLSRQLARLKDDVPVEVDWTQGKLGNVDREALVDLCNEFGFNRLTERILGLAMEADPVEWIADYQIVATPAEFAELLNTLKQQRQFSFDTETTSPHPRFAEVVGYAFSWAEGSGVYVPVRALPSETELDPDETIAALKPILEDENIKKVGQNLKYDIIVLKNLGVELRGVGFDTMVADYLIAPGERSHSIDDMARRYFNHKTVKIKQIIGSGSKQIQMNEAPLAEVAPYAAEDADVPLRLLPLLEQRLEKEELGELFRTLELPLLEVLAEMEFAGICIDTQLLEKLSKRYADRIDQKQAEIFTLAGREFNLDSPQQLAEVLYNELGLPVVKRTKTGPSTDAEAMQKLADEHAIPAKIIAYRQDAKLKNTYIDALPKLRHPGTGRIHTSFNQDVTATGRLSSKDPNLQNIPIRTEEGREIRAAFVAPPGKLLIAADYSQIELRVLAHFSGDAALTEAFAADRDIHAEVAADVFEVPRDAVTAEMRRRAKAVNFGVIYGQTPFGLAKALKIEREEAAEFIDTYFARYHSVQTFMEETLDFAHARRFVATISGRRRYIDAVRSAERRQDRPRTMPERIAVNTVIQGSAADLIKLAMLRVSEQLKMGRFPETSMLLQIHDELVLEAPEAIAADVGGFLREEMAKVHPLSVPLKVDVKLGPNWAGGEPL